MPPQRPTGDLPVALETLAYHLDRTARNVRVYLRVCDRLARSRGSAEQAEQDRSRTKPRKRASATAAR
jgi:hypothetical protein